MRAAHAFRGRITRATEAWHMSVFFTLRRARSLLAMAAFIAGVTRPAPTPAFMNTITVTTTSDALVNDGNCSMREASINANNDAATWPDCPAGSGDDTIILPAGTITLTVANIPPLGQPGTLDTD